jgi:hypothetical protein
MRGIVRVVFDRDRAPEQAPGLFAPGEAWLRAAQAWAAAQGQTVERWAIDQRVLVGGRWYAVAWNDKAEQWDFRPVE